MSLIPPFCPVVREKLLEMKPSMMGTWFFWWRAILSAWFVTLSLWASASKGLSGVRNPKGTALPSK